MLLKSVLECLKKKIGIEKFSIIRVKSENDFRVCFTGTLEELNQSDDTDMLKYRESLLNSEVVAREYIASANHSLLFICDRDKLVIDSNFDNEKDDEEEYAIKTNCKESEGK